MFGNPGALVYGTVTVGAVLAAESAQRETYASTLEAAVVALTLYWLAHAYAQFTRHRAHSSEPVKLGQLATTMVQELAIIIGAAFPLIALLACWAAGVALTDAVIAATWTSAGMIVVIELVFGLRDRLVARDFLAQTAVGILLGVLVIVLRTLLH